MDGVARLLARDADLVAYYDREAELRIRRDLGPLRHALRTTFLDLLHDEGRASVLDVGAGPGRDAIEFAAAGCTVTAVDLAPGNVALMVAQGIDAQIASLFELPYPPGSFDAVWTMSTLVHVPDDRLAEALRSIVSMARPGAPVGIGTWGGFDWEGVSDVDTISPARFFALRTHEQARRALVAHGELERFEIHRPDPSGDWQYQFAILRA